MSYNHTKNYFDFYGRRYGIGTIVKFKPEELENNREVKRCNGVAKFVGGLDSGYLKFSGIVPLGTGYCGIAIFDNPESRIEEIMESVYYENNPVWQIAINNYMQTHPERRADITPGTVLYITAMLAGTIFNARIAIWAVATFLYIKYLVDIYRD